MTFDIWVEEHKEAMTFWNNSISWYKKHNSQIPQDKKTCSFYVHLWFKQKSSDDRIINIISIREQVPGTQYLVVTNPGELFGDVALQFNWHNPVVVTVPYVDRTVIVRKWIF